MVSGFFSCPRCHAKWNSCKAEENISQECKICRASVFPCKVSGIKMYRQDGTGYFNCTDCDNNWVLNDATQNVSAVCFKCHERVFPDEVEFDDSSEESSGSSYEEEEESFSQDSSEDFFEESSSELFEESSEDLSLESSEESFMDTDDEEEYDSDDEEFYPYENGPFLGSYKCCNCNNKWKSSHSWSNTYQKCKFCKKHIYPHHQSLMRRIGRKISITHRKDLCGKCIFLQFYCRMDFVRN